MTNVCVQFAASMSLRIFGAKLIQLVLLTTLVLGVACGDDDDGDSAAKVGDPNQTGAALVTRYVTLVQDKDVSGLQSFMSEAFIIQRANGSNSEKAAYLENLPDVGDFTISDVVARQAGNTLVVRWSLTVEEVIDGEQFSGEPAPRLSKFAYADGEWRLTSHANSNVPVVAPAGN